MSQENFREEIDKKLTTIKDEINKIGEILCRMPLTEEEIRTKKYEPSFYQRLGLYSWYTLLYSKVITDPSNLPDDTFRRLPISSSSCDVAYIRSYLTREAAMQAFSEATKTAIEKDDAEIEEADAEIEEVEEPVNYQPYAVVVDGEKEYCWYHAGHYAVSDKHDPSNLPPELFELLQDSNKYKSTTYLRSYYTYEGAMAALHTAQGKNKEEEVNQTQETQKYRIYLDDKAKFTVRLASACEGIANYRFLRDDIEICEWSDELEAVDYLNIHFRAEIIDPQFVAANNTALRRNS